MCGAWAQIRREGPDGAVRTGGPGRSRGPSLGSSARLRPEASACPEEEGGRPRAARRPLLTRWPSKSTQDPLQPHTPPPPAHKPQDRSLPRREHGPHRERVRCCLPASSSFLPPRSPAVRWASISPHPPPATERTVCQFLWLSTRPHLVHTACVTFHRCTGLAGSRKTMDMRTSSRVKIGEGSRSAWKGSGRRGSRPRGRVTDTPRAPSARHTPDPAPPPSPQCPPSRLLVATSHVPVLGSRKQDQPNRGASRETAGKPCSQGLNSLEPGTFPGTASQLLGGKEGRAEGRGSRLCFCSHLPATAPDPGPTRVRLTFSRPKVSSPGCKSYTGLQQHCPGAPSQPTSCSAKMSRGRGEREQPLAEGVPQERMRRRPSPGPSWDGNVAHTSQPPSSCPDTRLQTGRPLRQRVKENPAERAL